MWWASLDSPTPRSNTASAERLDGVLCSSANAAPSPIEMPLRAASNGRQGASDNTSSEPKP
jgi:hypothetical protein